MLARLIENRRANLRTELRPSAEPAIHPHLDVIGARGDGLVDFGPCLLRCRDLRIGREAVFHGGDSCAAQLAALLRFPHLDDFVRIGLHAGHGGHAVKRVLAQLRLSFCADVTVGVNDAG